MFEQSISVDRMEQAVSLFGSFDVQPIKSPALPLKGDGEHSLTNKL